MFDRLIILLGALGPLIGSALVTSRRSRLVSRARAYNKLAKEIEDHSPGAAADARALVAEMTARVVEQERTALGRRFEVAGAFAWALFVLPAAVGSYFAWTHAGWWTWPVVIVSACWFLLCTAATWGEVWKVPELATGDAELRGA